MIRTLLCSLVVGCIACSCACRQEDIAETTSPAVAPNKTAKPITSDSQAMARAEEAILTLGDFDLALEGVRSEFSVERELPFCTGATGGSNVVFKSEGSPFLVAGVTLTARREGTVTLIPEFFILRDFMWFSVCHGIRVVEPAVPLSEAFLPPDGLSVWPGHAGDRIPCEKGDSIKVELLFGDLAELDGPLDAEILIAVPGSRLQRRPGKPKSAQQAESTVPSKGATSAPSDVR